VATITRILTLKPAFVVIGIPLRGFYPPFLSAALSIPCSVAIKVESWRGVGVGKAQIRGVERWFEDRFAELIQLLGRELKINIMVDASIECSAEVPELSKFVLLLLSASRALGFSKLDEDSIWGLSYVASKVLDLDPAMIASLFCATLKNSMCVAKVGEKLMDIRKELNIELKKLRALNVHIKSDTFSNEIAPVLGLLMKLSTMVISLFVSEAVDKRLYRSFLGMVLDAERHIAEIIIGSDLPLCMPNGFDAVKPILSGQVLEEWAFKVV